MKRHMRTIHYGLLLGAILCIAIAVVDATAGELRLASLFRDGAILQRDKEVAVWGRAAPGEKVTVNFADAEISATAGADGKWLLKLPAMQASAESRTLKTSGSQGDVIEVKDVLVGEVWLVSGQSNMAWHVILSTNSRQEIEEANYSAIREFRTALVASEEPKESIDGMWREANPKNVGRFSAVAYYFARDIHKALGVPVGIVNASWGGKMIEVFLSPESLSEKRFEKVHVRYQQEVDGFGPKVERQKAMLAAWEKERDEAQAAGKPFTRKAPMISSWATVEQHRPGCVFDGMMVPLIPYSIRGFLWYQGEHNISRPDEYVPLLTEMIRDWRARFGQGELPFYLAQLSSFGAPLDKSGEGYSRLREAQEQVADTVPNSGIAITVDIGNEKNVHPENKQDVGARLARLAKNNLYGMQMETSGPRLSLVSKQGSEVLLVFDHVTGGLVFKNDESRGSGFELAGKDGRFYPASVVIEGNKIRVKSPDVQTPASVRYAWGNFPTVTLFNGEKLPAPPFRKAVE